jgi:oxygen-dependent protoporphyrinogen oxidase
MERIVIVGGGISGLATAYYLLQKRPDIELLVLEAEKRPGGKVWTERTEGFICEAGVNGFLDNKQGTISLARLLGLEPLRSSDSARKRAVYINGTLKWIPDTPPKIFLSSFLSRRVGREFFEKLLDPMVTGIYAGDPSKLSIKSCFPKVYELEKRYGGLIKGFIKLQKERKRQGGKVEAGPGGVLHSFKNGMFTIIEILKDRLGERVKMDSPVTGIERIGNLYKIYCTGGATYETPYIVIATPAHNSSQILRELNPSLSALLKDIPYPPLSVVALGFRKEDIKADTDYFGFLVAGKEKGRILGCLFDSSIFPGRAPEGHILLRCMIGGARAPELAMLDDKELIKLALEELDRITGIKGSPVYKRIFRYDKAIPQYVLGHSRRLEDIEKELSRTKGLYLTGNAYYGVAMNDCIQQGALLAERIVAENR